MSVDCLPFIDGADPTDSTGDQVVWTTLDAIWLDFKSSSYIRKVCGEDRAFFLSFLEGKEVESA